jgi:hypothetical protein
MLSDAKARAAKPRPKPYKLTDSNQLFLLVTVNTSIEISLSEQNYLDAKRGSALPNIWINGFSE